jgi:uncharacterized protein YcbK (DUF882 family)
MAYVSNEDLFPIWVEPRSFWERTGVTPEQQRKLNIAMVVFVVLLTAGWGYSVSLALRRGFVPDMARQLGAAPASPLSNENAPPAAFLLDAALRRFNAYDELRGESGAVRAVILQPGDTSLPLPDSLTNDVALAFAPAGADSVAPSAVARALPSRPGIWSLLVEKDGAIKPIPNTLVVTEIPMSVKKNGKIGRFNIGNWPYEKGGKPSNPIYATPRGMIEVTPENKETYLTEHIQLKDFITKGQESIWPKYVVVQPRVLDKIELVLKELGEMGHPVENIFAVSGFRTPWYNANGGTTAGRGQLSRHMYGDAMDIAVDNDRNGIMDDLNRDGKINLSDARVIGEAVDRVERKYPHLVGGMHYYPPTGGHRGMVHIDTRGNRARW